MKKYLHFLILFFIILPSWVHALDVPPLQGYVNDYAVMISPAAKERLEGELKAFEQSDSTQLVILTIPSLQGETIEEFGIQVAEAWKIGQKNKDNGIIILIAKQEHEIRIEVGRGLEGRLTDLLAGRIVNLVISPRFKRGDFDGGVMAGVLALIDATRGEFKAEGRPPAKQTRGLHSFLVFLVAFFVVLIMVSSLSRILGGFVGAVGLPALLYLGLFPLGLVALILSVLVGAGIGALLPSLFSAGTNRGGGFWPGGGFFPFGGGGWGGGDSGGGFGGGGGDFGGGGASGDW
jgi:uncharacterized protein